MGRSVDVTGENTPGTTYSSTFLPYGDNSPETCYGGRGRQCS